MRMTRVDRSKAGKASAIRSQLDLFSFAGAAVVAEAPPRAAEIGSRSKPEAEPTSDASAPAAAPTRPPASARKCPPHNRVRVVRLDDLPQYPQVDQDLVDQSIAALPPTRMWFTYQAIRECFGLSRATVARRVKKGLVPGIRFSGISVIEDGAVRRFDRVQLRWLLLSVRSKPN